MASYEAAQTVDVLNEREDFCALRWWGEHAKDFPTLARMAADHLGIPCSAAEAERLFSIARRLITFDRNRIMDDLVSRILELRSWAQAYGNAWLMKGFPQLEAEGEEDEE